MKGCQPWAVYGFALVTYLMGKSLQHFESLPLYGSDPTETQLMLWMVFVMAWGAMEVARYYGERILDELSDECQTE